MYVPEGSPLPKVLFPDASKSVFFEIEALGEGEKASLKVESCQVKIKSGKLSSKENESNCQK